ncbi:MAG: protoheme IX farnesyltransferase [Phycisphaerales bacterium]
MSRTARASVISVPDHPEAPAHARRTLAAIVETTKPRITKLVVVTAGVGFAVSAVGSGGVGGASGRAWTLGEFLLAAAWCLLGTALSAAGANALNQWMERDRDARMARTATRPLPEGRLTPTQVFVAAAMMAGAGVGVLWIASGVVAAAIALTTIATYLLLYTPLKPVTSLATLVGAVPGALPPLIGWAAADALTQAGARGNGGGGWWGGGNWSTLADPGAWTLFLIMFVWQIPHFLAIAWMYRDDYTRGGYRVLPAGDATGSWTSAAILAWTLLLVPVTLAPGVLMQAGPGPGYFVVALATGLAFLALALRLCRTRTREAARATFLASIIHLPVLLLVLVADTAATALW